MPGNTKKVVRGNPARASKVSVQNTTGATLLHGTVVYPSDDSTDPIKVALAKADSASTMPCIGLVDGDIANNAEGEIVRSGWIENVNTSSFARTNELFVSPDTAGAMTTTQPDWSEEVEKVGCVLKSHATEGIIEVYSEGKSVRLTPVTTKGDLIVRGSSEESRLPIGDNGQVLKANSAADLGVEWAAESGGSSNLDGGEPDTNYGGITALDGGTP